MNDYAKLKKVAGEGCAKELAERLGGRPLYIPVALSDNHPITLIAGYEKAELIFKELGGQSIQWPSKLALESRERKRSIVESLEAGSPPATVATLHGVTIQYVRRLKRISENV